jgi:lipopolysaccharide heptosyltransferase II
VKPWNELASILAVRLDGLGDLLMTTPALRALKEAHPGRSITLLTSGAGFKAVGGLPFVDDVLVFEAPWMKHGDMAPAAMAAGLERLRQRRFDGAVIFTVHTQSALPAAMLCMLAGIPRRIAHCRENPYGLLTDWVRETDLDMGVGVRHEVMRQVDLVAATGTVVADTRLAYEVRASARERMQVKARHAELACDERWIVLHPGATAPSRRYAISQFAEAARQLAACGAGQLVLAGGAEDADAIAQIRLAAPQAVDLGGQLTLPEFAALLEAAAVLVANNSGPVHLAAAVGTPVVDLYALTNPQHLPWGVPHRVLNRDVSCRNCLRSMCVHAHHPCLDGVAPETVVQAVFELLHETAAGRRNAMPASALPALLSA